MKLDNDLDYDEIKFPAWEKDFGKIETKNNIYINVFCYKNELIFTIYVSSQKLKSLMDLLLVNDDDKSHYVFIKKF